MDRRKFSDVLPAALQAGWIKSKNKNQTLIWDRDPIGRIEWFTSGKVLAHVRKPHSKARACTLIGRAFAELIADGKILGDFLNGVEWYGAHDVFKTPGGQNVPYMVIDNYVELLGFRIKMGDYSHRDGLEIEWVMPSGQEKLENKINHIELIQEKQLQVAEKQIQLHEKLIEAIEKNTVALEGDPAKARPEKRIGVV
jgi:hypothetical protein